MWCGVWLPCPERGVVLSAVLHHPRRVGNPTHAVPWLQTDLTHVNILAELYCEAGQWAPALAICQRAERELLAPDEQLPVDLKVGRPLVKGRIASVGCSAGA